MKKMGCCTLKVLLLFSFTLACGTTKEELSFLTFMKVLAQLSPTTSTQPLERGNFFLKQLLPDLKMVTGHIQSSKHDCLHCSSVKGLRST